MSAGRVPERRVSGVRREGARAVETEDDRFRRIIYTLTDAILIVDHEGIVQFANPGAAALFGRRAAALVGEPFGAPMLRGEIAEIDIHRPDGSHVAAELRITELPWEGRPAWLASLHDMTERKQAEVRARELIRAQTARAEAEDAEQRAEFLSEAGIRFSSLLSPDAVLEELARVGVPFLADACLVSRIGSDGELCVSAVEHRDPETTRLLAVLKDKALEPSVLPSIARVLATGRAILIDDVRASDLAAIAASWASAAAQADVRIESAIVLPLIARDRALGIAVLCRERGATYSARDVAVAQDLGRRAAIAMDTAQLYETAQDANRIKAEFLAVMSHELRTPLNAITGYSDLLTMGVPAQIPAPAQEQVERIRSSARHLLRLIEEILTYSRLEAGREEVRIESMHLADAITEAANIAEPLARAKHIGFWVHVVDARIETDRKRLCQVLVNLMSNAVKFTDTGGVSVDARVDDGHAVFTVRDTGAGIEPEDLARIFEPFWQAEQSRTRRAEGTGLGLAVARRLTHLLAAELTVASRVGEGSTFTVRLPLVFPRRMRRNSGEDT